MRIGDAVLIEGEWGYAEEIGATFVTVATWDQRSLILADTRHRLSPRRPRRGGQDRRVIAVQVTDLKERTMEIRVLLSASDASRMFDLLCLVREKLVTLLSAEHSVSLPRVRVEIEGTPPRRAV